MHARNVMDTRFHILRPSHSIAEAVKKFHSVSSMEKKRIFELMVIDEQDRLVGMLSMYDILIFIQPKHVHLWSEMDDAEAETVFDELLERVKSVRVGDIMVTDVITVSPETHLIVVVDLMIRHHIRRIPVVDGREVVGIVYILDLFDRLLVKKLV